VAFNLQKLGIVDVFYTEAQAGTDISCSQEEHNDRGKEYDSQ
jgi:hypothetical protein